MRRTIRVNRKMVLFIRKLVKHFIHAHRLKDTFFFGFLVDNFQMQFFRCYFNLLAQGKNYIPIHKKPWKIAENLDIIVPFGYNTVIVKSRQNKKKKPVRDRFEEAFYSD